MRAITGIVPARTQGLRAAEVRRVLEANGTESLDAARHRWWAGLRGAECETDHDDAS